jgi:hypothetical protein
MDKNKTVSEKVFEDFLKSKDLKFDPITRATTPRPDYIVHFDQFDIIFEIKELSEDDLFNPRHVSSRTTGHHIRAKITRAKDQIKYGHSLGIPSVLVVYNNIDPLHLFGTEDHDFLSAMYGETTILLNSETGRPIHTYNGRNKSLSKSKRTYFSAVGRLKPFEKGINLTLFENIHADIPIPCEKLPNCFELNLHCP